MILLSTTALAVVFHKTYKNIIKPIAKGIVAGAKAIGRGMMWLGKKIVVGTKAIGRGMMWLGKKIVAGTKAIGRGMMWLGKKIVNPKDTWKNIKEAYSNWQKRRNEEKLNSQAEQQPPQQTAQALTKQTSQALTKQTSQAPVQQTQAPRQKSLTQSSSNPAITTPNSSGTTIVRVSLGKGSSKTINMAKGLGNAQATPPTSIAIPTSTTTSTRQRTQGPRSPT